MNNFTRRKFLQSSAILATAAAVGTSFVYKRNDLPLSFSTLGCPDWSFQQILDFAAAHNYAGIELRGIQRQLDLTKCNEFSSTQSRQETKRMLKEKGVKLVNLGSSANLHFADLAERKKNLDDAKRFIDLAHELNCPYIRVFPNNFPKDQEKKATMDLIASGLVELGAYAKDSKVTVLLETHGDLVQTEDVYTVMQATAGSGVALIWDIVNMWSITKEPPATVLGRLMPFIRHTHIKDGKMVEGKMAYTLLGKGESPIFEAIDLLAKSGYQGYYSFEWEKLWHPEIAEPEIALADYARAMKEHQQGA